MEIIFIIPLGNYEQDTQLQYHNNIKNVVKQFGELGHLKKFSEN